MPTHRGAARPRPWTYYFDVKVYPLQADFVLRELHTKALTPAIEQELRQNCRQDKPDCMLALAHHRS